MQEVCIGVAGAGRAAELHMNALDRVSGIPIRRKKIMARRPEQLEAAKKRYGFEELTYSFEDLLEDPDIHVIDICTPPYAHADMVKKIIGAGKHVICEKPLTGYFGEEKAGQKDLGISKAKMYGKVLLSLDDIKKALDGSGTKFMYAENFVYAPAIVKAAEIVRAKKSRILYMKGEESLKGSSSPVAGEWGKTGGGSFMRVGTHPLTAILWLKQQEALARGVSIHVESVIADMGAVTPALTDYEHRHIMARPKDVEDIGTAILKFSDNSRAVVMATDTLLGGSKNYVELYCNDTAINCTLTLNHLMDTYFLDEQGLDDIYISEMLPSKIGWNTPFILDEAVRGYIDQMQDFMESVYFGKEPKAGFELAYETTRIVYAAYASAETGRRWEL